ncbi:MAG TPA: tellurite resistance TerB family protein [Azospirillaceae bacterium]|nr:tellurite resistance TerB family protein [Azospirillaceae bacterium]
MLWVYPVLDGLIRTTAAKPQPGRVAKVDGIAPTTRMGTAFQQALSRHMGEEEGVAPTLPGAATDAPESLLTPATLTALQEIRAADAEVMIRAMITAAKVDGSIDPEERRRIFTELNTLGAGPEERQLVLRLMDEPADVEDLLSRVTSPDMALEVYTASLLAIDADTPIERSYLATISRRLHLDPETVARLHHQFGAPPPL